MPLTFSPIATDSGQGAALVVLDYRTAYGTTKPGDASGVLTFTFPQVDAGFLWLVQRITVMCDSSTPTQAAAYAGDPVPQNFVDGTARGNFDTADESSPILVVSSQSLTVQWTGASVGAKGTARIQYQLVQRP